MPEPTPLIIKGIMCSEKCRFMQEYEHPHYTKTAWCGYLERELVFEEYWVAICACN